MDQELLYNKMDFPLKFDYGEEIFSRMVTWTHALLIRMRAGFTGQ